MNTNLDLDDRLVETARVLGGHQTNQEVITQALIQYTRHLQQLMALGLLGPTVLEATGGSEDPGSRYGTQPTGTPGQ